MKDYRMSIVGRVESVWRYPVKSMHGEVLDEAFVGFAGVYGDRLFAFRHAGALPEFPYLTAREQSEMLLYRPRFRHPERASRPANLAAAEALGPGVTPLYAEPADLAVDVETPSGDVLSVEDPALRRRLGEEASLSLLRSERALTDCRPVSLISTATVRQLGEEIGITLDKRRFRANIYLDLGPADGFAEDGYVGRVLQIGPKVVVSVLERDPRCQMIALDPETGAMEKSVLRNLGQAHGGRAGVYAAVLVEGMVRAGDAVEVRG
jgi:uncharacterized protein YcbX